jgi:methyl-accepting chemotaxis protein
MLEAGDEIAEKLQARFTPYNTKRIDTATKSSANLTASNQQMSTTLIAVAVVSVIAGLGLAMFATRKSITGPLDQLRGQMADMAGGRYDTEVVGTARGDEVGAMAQAVAVFRENGIAKLAADQAKARTDTEQKLVVDTVSAHLSELSKGDLTAVIKAEFPAEYAALKANFNDALGNLRELISAASESTAAIHTGSQEIAQASEDLARRTESNAASLEETAASVTQMDGRLRASAASATRTVERADQAIATVGGGRSVADEAVQAMGRVSDSAKGIDNVIEGLDKIAFQTRVLAMNAAVEAGRAGDAGRGFAVVADLVSALAMRAEEEAKRARDQLTVTQSDIVTAVEAVTKVDGALANISGDVAQVHELLA